jgi:hypothetical protein
MQELKQLQLDINKRQPKTRCANTLLLMHMFKSIVTTPKTDTFTRSLWRDLNAHAVINRFGMFFLQTQSNRTLEIEGLESDQDDLLDFIINRLGKKKIKRIQPDDFDSRRTAEYPLGTHPTWQEITDILLTSPEILVSSRCGNNFWNHSSGFSSLQLIIIDLMIKFSKQYWFTLHSDFLINGYPEVNSWNDVMHVWSVTGIQKLVQNPIFVPHKYHWSPLPRGRQQESFGNRATTFFPDPDIDIPIKSVWNRFLTRGYIKDYHEYITNEHRTEAEKEQLEEGLKQAFNLLDCLPNREIKTTSNPWRYDEDTNGPTFIVNAETYRIRGIGSVSNKNKTRYKLTAAGKSIDALLMADTDGITVEQAEKQIVKDRRKKRKPRWVTTAKNRRKPPIRKTQKKAVNQENSINEEEVKNLDSEEEIEEYEEYDIDDFTDTVDEEEEVELSSDDSDY